MTSCDELRMDLAGYVLGGLSEDEGRRVSEHLQRCPACQREYEELRGLPDLLALARPAAYAPPPHLRERVLSAAVRRRDRTRWLAAVAVAAVIGVLAGAVGVAWLGRATEPVVAVALEPEGSWDAEGRAAFSWADGEMTVRLTLRDVRALPGDAVYEAWLAPVPDGPPVSLGTFEPDRGGTVDERLVTAGPLDRWRSIWVTAEPNATDPSHDGPTVVAAPIPPRPGG